MNDPAAAFFEAIRAAPDDDAPRLIYADWLEEQGEREQVAQAAFIRGQCETHGAGKHDPAGFEQRLRNRLLAEEFSGAWTESLRPLGVENPLFERGLVVGFTIDAERFLAHADELARLCPGWRDATLRLAGASLDDVLKSDSVERLRGLTLENEDLGDDGAVRIAQAKRLRHLQRLAVPWGLIEDEGLAALANSAHLRKVVALDLSANRFGEAGLEALAQATAFGSVKSLRLCGLSAEACPAQARLAASTAFPSLEELSLEGGRLDDAYAEALAKGPLLRGVKRLDLGRCRAAETALYRLADGPGLSACEDLCLADNSLNQSAVGAINSSPSLANLRRLDLRVNDGLHAGGVIPLLNSEHLTNLEALNLTYTGLGNHAAMEMAASRNLSRLVELDLSGNTIGELGVVALANGANLGRLQVLNLSSNRCGDAGAKAIAGATGLPSLKSLAMWYTGLTDAGAEALAGSERLAGLRELRLGGNHFTDAGLVRLERSPHLQGLLDLNRSLNVVRAGRREGRNRA